MSIAVSTRPNVIPPFASLPSAARAKYHNNEVEYVFVESERLPDPRSAQKEYFKAADYKHVQQTLERPFRLNTAAMTGVSTAFASAGFGSALFALNALYVPAGALQIYEGVRNQDRRLIVDGALNAAIGVSSVVAAFSPFGAATFIPLGLVAGREAWMAASGQPLWRG